MVFLKASRLNVLYYLYYNAQYKHKQAIKKDNKKFTAFALNLKNACVTMQTIKYQYQEEFSMGFFARNDDDDDENVELEGAEAFSYMLDDVLDNINDLDEITLDAGALEMISERARKN